MRITAHDGLLRDLTRVAVAGQAPGGQQALGYDLSSFSTSTFSLTWASLSWPRFAHGAFTPLPRVSPRSRLRQSWPLPRESVPHTGRRVTEQRRLRDGPRPPASLRVPHAAVLSRLGHRSRVPLRDTEGHGHSCQPGPASAAFLQRPSSSHGPGGRSRPPGSLMAAAGTAPCRPWASAEG